MTIDQITKEELRAVAANARELAIACSERLWPDMWRQRVGDIEQFQSDILLRLCVDAALRDFQFGGKR